MTDTDARRRVNDMELELTVGGESQRIRFGDFSAIDARMFREQIGMTLRRAWFAVWTRDADFDVDLIAGLVWLHRQKSDPNLLWEDVAERVTYDDATRPQFPTDTKDDDEQDPDDPS